MTVINEHAQNTTNATLDTSTTDVNAPVDSHVTKSSQPEERPAIASTAAGIPAPAPVANALQEKNALQKEKELPGTGSTATGLPNPSAVNTAIEDTEKEKESNSSPVSDSDSDSVKANEETKNSKGSNKEESKRLSLKKAIDTVAHVPTAAAHKVIKKVTPSKSADTPSSDSTCSDQQQQRRQSEASIDDKQDKSEHKDTFVGDKQDKNAFVTSNEAVQAAIVSTAQSGAIDITTTCLPSTESEAIVPQSTHTPMDRLSEFQTTPDSVELQSEEFQSTHTPIDGSTGSQAVLPIVENIPISFESVQEPVVEEAIIETPSVCSVPADAKTEKRVVSEVTAPAKQVSVSQDVTGNVEQQISVDDSEEPIKTTATQSELVPSDVKIEQTGVAEEPVTTRNDIKVTEPIKNDTIVDQTPVTVKDNIDVKTEPVQLNKTTSDKPSDVTKVDDQSAGIKTEDGSTTVDTADDIKTGDKPIDTTTHNKPTDVKATAPQEPSTQATSAPTSRGISSSQPASDSKELPPQPSSDSDQPKGTTSSKSSSCTIM